MLQNNEIFPTLAFACAGGGEIHLPGDLAGSFGVVLFYRGAWSDACKDQLDAFSRAAGELAAEGVKVVAASVDDRRTTEALVEELHLGFPVAYAVDAHAVSKVTGVLLNEDAVYFEAAGFVLDPEGRIAFAVYSSGDGFEERIVTTTYATEAIGRLLPDDVIGLVRRAKSSKD